MDSDLQGLIVDIYDTVQNPARWHPVLDRVALLVGSRKVVLVERAPDHTGMAVPRYRADPLIVAGRSEPADQIVFARQILSCDDPAGIGADHRTRVLVRFLRRRGVIGPAVRDRLDILLPHIAKALELGHVFSRARGMAHDLAASLDWLRVGVCLIRADRTIIAQNAQFRRQVATTGTVLVSADNRVDMGRACDRAWFRRHMAQPPAPACCPADDAVALSIHLAPLMSPDATGGTRLDGYAIYCLDVACLAQIDLDAVSRRLSLTGSESELVALLADGLTNRQIAARRHRSVETVNSQVKSLLNKAHCGNRTQLVRRVTTLGGRILADHPDG